MTENDDTEQATVKQSEQVVEHLRKLDQAYKALQDIAIEMYSVDDRKMYPMDLLAQGALKRAFSTTSALKMLILNKNMLCSRVLVRTHLDTSLRFGAAWLVDDPHSFAQQVLAGSQISKMKDRSGSVMRDSYLAGLAAVEHPWIPEVYKRTSGYVHFSDGHLTASMYPTGEAPGKMMIELGPTDDKFPDSSWIEVIDCFAETSLILHSYVHGWALAKAGDVPHTPEEA